MAGIRHQGFLQTIQVLVPAAPVLIDSTTITYLILKRYIACAMDAVCVLEDVDRMALSLMT